MSRRLPAQFTIERPPLSEERTALYEDPTRLMLGQGDTKLMQQKVDDQRIRALALGLLLDTDLTTGAQTSPLRYYAPSKAKWITMAEAKEETGLSPANYIAPIAVAEVVELELCKVA